MSVDSSSRFFWLLGGTAAAALAGTTMLAGPSAAAGMRPMTGAQPKAGTYQYASVLSSVTG
jgi:hypothetical protein